MQSSSVFVFLIISGNKKRLNMPLVHVNDHPVKGFFLYIYSTSTPAGKKYPGKVFKVNQNRNLWCLELKSL